MLIVEEGEESRQAKRESSGQINKVVLAIKSCTYPRGPFMVLLSSYGWQKSNNNNNNNSVLFFSASPAVCVAPVLLTE